MHRSGTSSVTGALTLAGAQAPLTLMPAKPDNPTGFWESERIAAENDLILRRFNAEWDTLGQFDSAELVSDGPLIDHLVSVLDAEFPDPKGPPILKDPRICRLAPLWLRAAEAWGRPARVLMPVRPPAEVAASLNRRNKLPVEHGIQLWIDHVIQAERDSRHEPRALLAWSDVLANPTRTLRTALDRIEVGLNIEASEDVVDSFVDPSRRHERLTLAEIEHPQARRAELVYDALAALNLSPSDPSAQAQLDALAISSAP